MRWKDWLLVACLVVLIGVVELAPGRRMYLTTVRCVRVPALSRSSQARLTAAASQSAWEEVKYPYRSNTVPSWTLPLLALVIPFAGVIGASKAFGLSFQEQHGACLGVLSSVAVTTLITDVIKLTVRAASESRSACISAALRW